MSALTIYNDNASQQVLFHTEEGAEISSKLAEIGVRFERWQADREVTPEMDAAEVLAAYSSEIDKLKAQEGYVTVDLISLDASHPQKDELRKKFLAEHTHSEDEVRFFVAGEGLFYLHLEAKVFAVHCRKNDLISVPKDTTHWFDMGPNPDFSAIRLFNNPDGWVANFTGSDIAERFPLFD